MRVSKKRTRRENTRRSVEIAMREYDGIIEHRRQKYLKWLKEKHHEKQSSDRSASNVPRGRNAS